MPVAHDDEIKRLRFFGQQIGLAFQIVDDVLDLTQTSEQLGKTAGKDTAAEKTTYPALFGIDESLKKSRRAGRRRVRCNWIRLASAPELSRSWHVIWWNERSSSPREVRLVSASGVAPHMLKLIHL